MTIVEESPCCIAIVGAGFCGTVTAVNLLRQSRAQPLRILLIDRERHGRGAAYAALSAPHLLNVPASRMSAISSDPLHFLRFAQQSIPQATGEDFLPRAMYGDYLEELLASAERSAPAHVRLERVRGTVKSVDIWRPEHTFILGFEGGQERTATQLVLAMGNPPPAQLKDAQAVHEPKRLVENPWCEQGTIEADETVLVVGTGLTMADIVASSRMAGSAKIHAISRHGLVPPRQTAFRHSHSEFDPSPLLRAASSSMRQLFHEVRQICRDAERNGGDWREAITFVRTLAPRLWSKLPLPERRRFLRHVRTYWDVHRHRLPPSTRATLDELRDARQLMVHAGSIVKLETEGSQVRVTWRPRGQEQQSVLLVDRVINCTGPDYRYKTSRDPLVQHLIANGLIQPDPLGIGLRTGPNGGVLTVLGHQTRGLYYVGPMLRADYWEATAVGELRERAESLASHLAAPVKSAAAVKSVN